MKIVELFPFRNTFFYVRESACDTTEIDTLAADHLVHLLGYEENDGKIIRYWWVATTTYLDGFHTSLFEVRSSSLVDPRTIKPGEKSKHYVLSGQSWTPPAGRPSRLCARLERSYKPRVIPGRFARFFSAVRACLTRVASAVRRFVYKPY
jgi:hypothetical protein